MKDSLNFILSRRSIRQYADQPVELEKITGLLKCAMSAPSACNQQPWHFIIIENAGVKQKISEIHSGFSMVKDAPAVILVCAEPGAAQLEFFCRQDCSAATENILIAANTLGLGAVWLGINPAGGEDSDILRGVLGIPANIYPFALIPVGYPAESKPAADRFNIDRVHYNSNW